MSWIISNSLNIAHYTILLNDVIKNVVPCLQMQSALPVLQPLLVDIHLRDLLGYDCRQSLVVQSARASVYISLFFFLMQVTVHQCCSFAKVQPYSRSRDGSLPHRTQRRMHFGTLCLLGSVSTVGINRVIYSITTHLFNFIDNKKHTSDIYIYIFFLKRDVTILIK